MFVRCRADKDVLLRYFWGKKRVGLIESLEEKGGLLMVW